EALLRDRVDALEDGASLPADEGLDQRAHLGATRDAERLRDLDADEPLPTERDDLIEERERVAHRAGGLAGDERDRVVVGGDALLAEDLADPSGDHRLRDEPEVVALAARADGDGDLVDLRRREDELHMGRRLLERFEERVERRRR